MNPDVCIFCSANGCETGTADHGIECPFTTGMWPVDEWMLDHEINCMACEERFQAGETYAEVRADWLPTTGIVNAIVADLEAVDDTGNVTLSLCLPCAALGRPVES